MIFKEWSKKSLEYKVLLEYAAFGDYWGIMRIPQFSPNFGENEIATSMGKIGKSFGWGQSNILGNNGENPQNTSNFEMGTGTAVLGNLVTLV